MEHKTACLISLSHHLYNPQFLWHLQSKCNAHLMPPRTVAPLLLRQRWQQSSSLVYMCSTSFRLLPKQGAAVGFNRSWGVKVGGWFGLQPTSRETAAHNGNLSVKSGLWEKGHWICISPWARIRTFRWPSRGWEAEKDQLPSLPFSPSLESPLPHFSYPPPYAQVPWLCSSTWCLIYVCEQ